ncbi:glycoside hydrolase family 31 protein [Paraflavitalea sp. CAU 1676]|uniref:glycoside hydrolase family 31 protein n=1 Tax=Paraflavitalea sp. CAU 1676 TaxID=3032598 RepID=UPI0023DC7F36|nr:glycoside hydrolase family 31 protein [Paraflavitalea sp. CAU 1676]MDF2186795.1 glycoside hydrolase family 31 protein [Paraflavitalea sp. CAU 1676]
MKKAFLFSAILVASLAVLGQDQVTPVGDVRKVTFAANQLDLTTANAYVRIQAYGAAIIRVRISNRPFQPDFSYAVIAEAGKPALTRNEKGETAGEINLQTDSIKVRIRKAPFAISFYTPDGQLINQDEPGLGTSWIGTEVTTYKHMQDGERFIGLGEKTGNLDRKGNAYTNWNSDVFGYSVSQDPLYSTIPFYIGIHHGLQYGIFFDNSFQSDFNFGASNNRFSSFGARGGEMNYYFMYQPSVAGIIRSYTQLTGRMTMPPLWSLGYQQNRYSYYPDTEVYRIAQTLREKKIPADGITLDIHYMDAYKLFTWNKERFPDPKGMIDSLHRMGLNTTLIVDPGIKVEKDYPAYESGLRENIFLKYTDGLPYTGEVWPGWCHFPDFTSEKGRNWWKGQVTNYTNVGVNGIWNDMNEIATWGQKMPGNVLFDYDGHPTTHLKGHNVFGLQMARSSYEAARQALQKRPFILTRAGYAGLQRYTALWTGDNRAEDDHMLTGVRLLTSLGLSGVPFTGMDVGGFTGNPTVGLYTRWMQLGAFIPYFRNHTQLNTKSAEPWSFGEDVLATSRNYINLRYRLLPYLYSVFQQATQEGMPVVRSLAIDYTHDARIYNPAYQNQFLFGPGFLVMPEESVQQFAKVYLPAGEWYDLYNDVQEQGAQEKLIELSAVTLPVYVRGGSIIPMQSLIQNTTEKPTDTLTLQVYKGSKDSRFVYYEDDGASYQYEQGDYYKRSMSFDAVVKTITLDAPTGNRASQFKYIRIALHGFAENNLQVNGRAVSTTDLLFSYLNPKPLAGEPNSFTVKSLVLENSADKIVIKY